MGPTHLCRCTHMDTSAAHVDTVGQQVNITYIPGEAVEPSVQARTSRSQHSPQKLAQPALSASLGSDDTVTPAWTESHLSEDVAPPSESPRTATSLSECQRTTTSLSESPITTTSPSESPRTMSSPGARASSMLSRKSLQADGSWVVGNQVWGPPRSVHLYREEGKSLGLSIVGGRVDVTKVSPELSHAGIFIKQVVSGTPAGRNGTLKKGDRILEVNGCDVRNATHDEAVETIRNSPNPIVFLVQSLTTSVNPGEQNSTPLITSVQPVHKAALISESDVPSNQLKTESAAVSSDSASTSSPLMPEHANTSSPLKSESAATSSLQNTDESAAKSAERTSEIAANLSPIQGNSAVTSTMLKSESAATSTVLKSDSAATTFPLQSEIAATFTLLQSEIAAASTTIKTESAAKFSPLKSENSATISTSLQPGGSPTSTSLQPGGSPISTSLQPQSSATSTPLKSESSATSTPLKSESFATSTPLKSESSATSTPLKSESSATSTLLKRESTVTPSPDRMTHEASMDSAEIKVNESFTDSESEDEFGYTQKRIQRKYMDLPGSVHLVEVDRGHSGLGLGLAGNKDRNTMSVFVAGVQPDGPAGRDGRVLVGDELLEINKVSLQGLSHLNASAVIKGLTAHLVKLVLHRRVDFLEHMAVRPLQYVGSSHFSPLPPLPLPGTTDTDTTSSGPSRRASSATSYSHSSSITAPALTPAEAVQIIVLQKLSSQGLGFGIQEEARPGRTGIFVNSITEGGVAYLDNQLDVGDEILEVGDKSLAGLHYDKAIELLRAAQGSVRLKVQKTSGSLSGQTPGTDNNHSKQLLWGAGESPEHVTVTESGEPGSCPVVAGRCSTIEISRGKNRLGLGVVGGADTLLKAIVVHEIYQGGAAALDGRLWVGDQILEVNGQDLSEASHSQALLALRQSPSQVRLVVYRDQPRLKPDHLLDVFPIEMSRRPGKGLGLSIAGLENKLGVFVAEIVKGSAAEADGRLMQGDQILAVNGEDLRSASQEHAATYLKTFLGKLTLSIGRLKVSTRSSSKRATSGRSRSRHSKSSSEDPSQQKHGSILPDSLSSHGASQPVSPAPCVSVSPNLAARLTRKLQVESNA